VGRTSDARERLIDAAIELIWPSNYGMVGVDAICERSGVKKGSFYHFFESKDDLVMAALEHHWQTRRPIMDAIFSATKTPMQRLQDYFVHIRERQNELRETHGRVLGCFHNSVGNSCIEQPAEIAKKVQEVIANFVRYLTSTIREAQGDGLIRAGDPQLDAETVFAIVQGTLLQARIHDDLTLLRDLPRRGFAVLGIQEPKPVKTRSSAHA
jgi:TetR/AcrR family transcriptional repressor of nem operon